ncbi:GntR family transcriptional regulator [Terrarubrum flagellatum]|uniref:GntR family transcriptional regulator n=1 Tax=Terrirubrum flagellatum TaxID=2895980 RepID=UPI0031452DD9
MAIETANLAMDGAAPLYEIVKRRMSESILFGEWPPGSALPSEVALAQSFGVAVGTMRRALSDLAAEGLLSRRRKTGTVVTGRTPHHSLRFFFQYFRLHGMDGALLRSNPKVLGAERGVATSDEATRLELAPEAEVLRIHRLRLIEGRPIMRDRYIFPAARLPDFPTSPDAMPELLYLHLLERYGIRISAVREQITAELADEEDARLLELERPASILAINEISFDQSGAPTILGLHRATTERHCYVNEVR